MPSFGHNGTGKTVLLNGVAKCLCLENLKNGGQAACDGVDLELSDTGMLCRIYVVNGTSMLCISVRIGRLMSSGEYRIWCPI